MRSRTCRRRRLPVLLFAVTLWLPRLGAAAPLGTTRDDFELPGTQPLSVVDPFATPDQCTPCHANYGQPSVEPYRNWQGSMMAHSGRDPLMWAALAIANQDAPHAGETCLRCHLPKGWLEGRSAPEDGSQMTAADRHGVQCGVCHRLVDPIPAVENPTEDGPILAALAAPVPELGSAMMVTDPLDRLRGPFDVTADLGSDPHAPIRSTLVSPFHSSSELCGVCHNVKNPLFTRNLSTGEYELNTLDAPGDPELGFPEQSTYDEWANSEFAASGVNAPQFGRNQAIVSECQDCHMPRVSGKDANLGLHRDDLPLHDLTGANTFIPAVLPHHPVFGAEVDAAMLNEGIARATDMLRKSATVSVELAAGNLTVRVTNEGGHKLPTGYPEGRRMWLHVRAFDADRTVVFESGRYVFATATLLGHDEPPLDPYLRVWETVHGLSADVALLSGVPAGASSHLVLNNVRVKDNRIPPRGFANAAFEAFDGHPIGAAYADGQHWDDVVYPVGTSAVGAEVTLYYQTASRDYVEFLRDENTTTGAGNILFDLWEQHNQSVPVAMAHAFLETDDRALARCQKSVSKAGARFQKTHWKEWSKCFDAAANGLPCDVAGREARIAAAEAKLREKIGGLGDSVCAEKSLTPISIGHGSVCPVPCPTIALFDVSDLASCAVCVASTVNREALESAYGATLPALPPTVPSTARSCQKSLGKAAGVLAAKWPAALSRCEKDNASGANVPPLDCSTDPDGEVAAAMTKAGAKIASCDGDFTGLAGCATTGNAAAVQGCMESSIGAVVPGFVEVAYP